jgi:hypothetical protein
MNSNLSRRDFLKFAPAFLLAQLGLPAYKRNNSTLPHQEQDPAALPNIIIIVFDALSARNMSLYGYERQTTPNMVRFAQRATVFHRHYSAGNFTPSGTASLLTGVYPWSHRAFHVRGRTKDEYTHKNIFSETPGTYYKLAYTQNNLAGQILDLFNECIDTLPKAEVTGLTSGSVAEKWFWNDFNTAYRGEYSMLGYYHKLPSLLLSSMISTFKGFRDTKIIEQRFGEMFPLGIPQTGDFMYFLLEDSMDWILKQVNQIPQPYLSYIHLWPPHDPLKPRVEFINLFDDGWNPPEKNIDVFSQGFSFEFLQENRRLYDEYIAYVDAEFGRLYDSMENAGLLKDTILILTSDHGELFERGIYGHITPVLFDPVIHIPLLISTPGQTQREDINIPTTSTDVFPTILSFLGQLAPEWIEGDVLPAYHPNPSSRDIYAMDFKQIAKNAPLNKGSVALIRDRYKLIHYFGFDDIEDRYELYDLVNDPEELENRYRSEKGIGKELKEALSEKIQS